MTMEKKNSIKLTSNEMKLPHRHHTEEEEQFIFENMPAECTIATVAEAMKQLGDPTRLRIFWLLCHTEECVVDIAAFMNMSSPAVSHHLRILKATGLVTTRREGKEVYYAAAPNPMVQKLHITIEEIAEINCCDH
ncbi:metalloregulator ArsR/SmtB family transcription factor [Anaerovibrio sp. RM50]|uniref:ArsR/SmtB family transcription factor n=1 Tax=Anaerovibrio sp. RM50 TaxID=1200557 RepID=UPI000B2B4D6E|nr:metalloregulator ArsR/SmtB family transcription factor [Anaerovibrio sp. RM50]